MSEMIRSFVALELDDATRHALADLQTRLQRDRNAKAVRWVAPANIHITLKFLGDVTSAQMPELQSALSEVCAGIAPFALTIVGTGAFPDLRRPNVIWVGARGEVAVATQLAEQIEDACEILGFAREGKPFAPHLTLGRVKRDVSPSERQAIGKLIEQTQVGELGTIQFARVSLMKSDLRPGGSVYTQIAEMQLLAKS